MKEADRGRTSGIKVTTASVLAGLVHNIMRSARARPIQPPGKSMKDVGEAAV